MTRYVKIIPAIKPITFSGALIKDAGAGKEVEWTIVEFIYDRMLEPPFGRHYREVAEIRQKCVSLAKEQQYLELPDKHWDLLRGACEGPTTGAFANPAVGWNFVPFANAIMYAVDLLPPDEPQS